MSEDVANVAVYLPPLWQITVGHLELQSW